MPDTVLMRPKILEHNLITEHKSSPDQNKNHKSLKKTDTIFVLNCMKFTRKKIFKCLRNIQWRQLKDVLKSILKSRLAQSALGVRFSGGH